MGIRRSGRRISAWKRLHIHDGLPRPEERETYISRLGELNANPGHKLIFEHLYTNLDALDNKSNSMIQFAAALVAVYAGLIALRLSNLHTGMADGNSYRFELLDVSLLLGSLCVFGAGVSFLLVERVHWSSVEDIADRDRHALHLLEVRDKRTIRYRIGWLETFAAFGFLMLSLLIAVVQYLSAGTL